MKLSPYHLPTLLVLVLLLTSCAGVAPQQVVMYPTTATYSASMEETWRDLVKQIGLKVPIKIIDKSSGLITTEYMSVGRENISKFALPPNEPFFFTRSGAFRMTVSILVSPIGNERTTVQIRATYSGLDVYGQGNWINCNTTGFFESGILSQLSMTLNRVPIKDDFGPWANP